MPAEIPSYPDEYIRWFKKHRSVRVDQPMRNHFAVVCNEMKLAFESCPLWCALQNQLQNYNDEYQASTTYDLITGYDPQIDIKTFESFLIKTYRKNVLNNPLWPEPPPDGWLSPPEWLSQVDDLVRTTIVVKYLDGIEFLVSKFLDLAKCYDVEMRHHMESRPEGYYAAHLYYARDVEIQKRDFNTEIRSIIFEIHVSTEVKQIIKDLLHKYYENRRMKPLTAISDWQWDYKSEEFKANYLGHIIHYVEGMIVEVRDRQREADQ